MRIENDCIVIEGNENDERDGQVYGRALVIGVAQDNAYDILNADVDISPRTLTADETRLAIDGLTKCANDGYAQTLSGDNWEQFFVADGRMRDYLVDSASAQIALQHIRNQAPHLLPENQVKAA